MTATISLRQTRAVSLRAYSREWWAAWSTTVDRGQPTAAMERAANHGRPWAMLAADRPSVVGFVAVSVDSKAFTAWSAHYLRRGRRLPRPDRVGVVFLKGELPPAAPSGIGGFVP